MAYRPPAGIAPPKLYGTRPGRPTGSKSQGRVRADIEWAGRNRHDPGAVPPTVEARFWWRLAQTFPEEFAFWVEHDCRVADRYEFYDGQY
jgi:hypothetical protein